MYSLTLLIVFCARYVWSRCECGYSVSGSDSQEPVIYQDLLETNFNEDRNISDYKDWLPQQFNVSAESGRGQYGKSFVPTNIVTHSGGDEGAGLGLRVGSAIENGAVPAAEIDTTRLDLHWGSYRAGMKLTGINGTCSAFFWYFNDTQEIDIEFLSREFQPADSIYPVNLVVQSTQSREAGYDASKTGTFKRVNLTFDPTADFHEYRFDYGPRQVVFYADSKKMALMEGDAIPSVGGHLILQHWSNGNTQWSGGPPVENATVRVSYVKAYFNSSDEERQSTLSRRCGGMTAVESICIVPDMSSVNARAGGTFLGGDEESKAADDVQGAGARILNNTQVEKNWDDGVDRLIWTQYGVVGEI
ncbi:concanavalin A-like lectin/glucanase domain-containing protein [Mariannaea sp. PMI_226]|nr:concanavalin A-like lectin/glucanase domain-containing protein [Mariannaea sp. PMI_226]